MVRWQNFTSAFLGRLAAVLFTAICTALGFGPDKWAAFVISGLPFALTPGVARLGFLLLASATLASIMWIPVVGYTSAFSKESRGLARLLAIAFICAPFVAGSFYVVNNISETKERHLSQWQSNAIRDSLLPHSPEFTIPVVVEGVDTPEALGYAREIMLALGSANIPLNTPALGWIVPRTMRAIGTGVRGVFIQVGDKSRFHL